MEKRIVLFSDLLNNEYKKILGDIAATYGYELYQILSSRDFSSLLKHRGFKALITDYDNYSDIKELVNENVYKFPVFILVDKRKDIKDDISFDGIILTDVSESVFEGEVISVFKYIILYGKLENTSKIIDPEFLRKLLGDTAHEVNNILTGIQGYAELAALNPGDEELIKDSFKVILDSSYRIRNEIKNLRAFVRIENPKIERISLSDIISQAIEFIKPQCRLKSCNVNLNLYRDFMIDGDKDQLVQVFFNVLHDLVYNSGDGAVIEITSGEESGKVVFNIKSTKHSISNDDYQSIKRILALNEPVLKMDSEEGEIENKNVLSMCGRIMFNHRGSIDLVKKGDSFVYEISLPYVKELPIEKEETEEAVGFDNIESLDMDILVVDDEEFVRNTLYYFFNQKGCRVTLAEDGKYGLELAKDKPFDIIFMDFLMPKMGGIESAKEILKEKKDARIVFITGKDTANESEILNAGVYAVIKKPFEIEDIYSVAKKIAMEKGIGS